MDITTRLETLAAAPKPWIATITLPDGTLRHMRQPREGMARSWAQRMHDRHGVPFTVAYQPE